MSSRSTYSAGQELLLSEVAGRWLRVSAVRCPVSVAVRTLCMQLVLIFLQGTNFHSLAFVEPRLACLRKTWHLKRHVQLMFV